MNSITLREKEVLQLLAQGFSTKEIACHLGISFHTVESHRKKLRFKFDAKNSTELLMKVMKVIEPADQYLNSGIAQGSALS